MADLLKELEAAKRAALEAGREILKYYDVQDLEVTHKGDNQPLTQADLAANESIKSVLTKEFPDDGWLSEEDPDSSERFSKKRIWVVDPLDGTSDFIRKNPEFAVSIGLIENGEPILGVVYQPVTKELFYGAKGLGAFFNDEKIRVKSPKLSNEKITVLASQSEYRRGEWERFEEDFDVKPTGGTAFKLALVASGRAHCCFTLVPKSEWDICGGHCLINEAGGILTTAKGDEVKYNQKKPRYPHLLYCSKEIHQKVLDMIKKRGMEK